MDATGFEPHRTRGQAREGPEDLDRKVFYLKTLLEASTELSGIVQPQKIMDTFLLMTMGPLGITRGVTGLVNLQTQTGHVTGRGLGSDELDKMRENLGAFSRRCFSEMDSGALLSSRIEMVNLDGFESCGLLPAQTHTLMIWLLTGGYGGFLALGEKLTRRPLDDGDIELLYGLTEILRGTMNHALSVLNIQQLNADLVRMNEELRASREELDRRVFHLKTLSDLSAELSPLMDLDRLLRTFLMMVTGSVGAGHGFLVIRDRGAQDFRFAGLGMERQPPLSGEQCDRWIYRAFDACDNKSFAPGSVCRVQDPTVLRQAGIEFEISLGFFWVVDASVMGILALGPKIQAGSYSAEDVDFVAAQTVSFLVYLKNAMAFETIQVLNRELTRSNEQLRRTIADLTEARHRITVLERARARLRSLVQQEADRIGRPNRLDYVLVLLLATVVGLLFNLAAPQGIPLVPETLLRPKSAVVAPREAMRSLEAGTAIIVDARPRELYEQRHIRGAVNVPLSLFDIMYMMKLSRLDPDHLIIVYGRHISRHYDEELAFRLRQRDHENVRVLEGGLQAWLTEELPVQ